MIYPCVAKSLFPDGSKSKNADIKKVVADITESLRNRQHNHTWAHSYDGHPGRGRFDAREKEENKKLKEAKCISPWKKCVEGATCCQPAHQYTRVPAQLHLHARVRECAEACGRAVVCLCVCAFVHDCVWRHMCMHVCIAGVSLLSVRPSSRLSIRPAIPLSICVSLRLSIRLSVRSSICLSVSWSVHLYVCEYVCLCICVIEAHTPSHMCTHRHTQSAGRAVM